LCECVCADVPVGMHVDSKARRCVSVCMYAVWVYARVCACLCAACGSRGTSLHYLRCWTTLSWHVTMREGLWPSFGKGQGPKQVDDTGSMRHSMVCVCVRVSISFSLCDTHHTHARTHTHTVSLRVWAWTEGGAGLGVGWHRKTTTVFMRLWMAAWAACVPCRARTTL
jgi:hypothetical protein